MSSNVARVNVTAAAATVTSVEVYPSTASVVRGQTQQFNATVSGTGHPAQTVTWIVEGNVSNGTSINASGFLTVAANETATSLTVTATSTVDANRSGTATVTILVLPSITTTNLLSGYLGLSYNQTLVATGTGPITWTITDGALPSGLTLDSTTGVISGRPINEGSFYFTVGAANIAGNTTQVLAIHISRGTLGITWNAVPGGTGTGNNLTDPGQSTFGANNIIGITYGVVQGAGRFVAVGEYGRMAWSE